MMPHVSVPEWSCNNDIMTFPQEIRRATTYDGREKKDVGIRIRDDFALVFGATRTCTDDAVERNSWVSPLP